jgi:hypothetical protein
LCSLVLRLLLPLEGRDHQVVVETLVALVGQGEQAVLAQQAWKLPDPGRSRIVDRAADRPRDPQQLAVRVGDRLQVHAVAVVLALVVGPVGG